jgi:hypothetical protein
MLSMVCGALAVPQDGKNDDLVRLMEDAIIPFLASRGVVRLVPTVKSVSR